MQTLEYTQETGLFKRYNIEDEIEILKKLPKDKPSTRIIRTKKGLRAIEGLKRIEIENNNSWYQEIKKIADENPDKLALFYRGTKIDFKTMMEKADEMAKSMKAAGIEKGDEIPVCLANTPELVYILLAANRIGAKLNLFGPHFAKEYLSEILDGCTNKLFIASDDFYGDIKDVVSTKQFNKKVVVSLADSLPEHPELCDEYEKELDHYYHYENKALKYKEEDSSISTFNEFNEFGKNYTGEIIDNNDLNTEFLTTYTSGSTSIGYPKALIHTNRSLIVVGRFHDPELCGNPSVDNFRSLAHIHSESNTDIITCISDALMQKWSVALEPEYGEFEALDYLFINKPNYASLTTSFLIRAAKQYLFEKKFHEDGKGRKLGFYLAAVAVGEGESKGEEKLINRFLRESKAGSEVKMKGLSIPFTTSSIGGGDCEHGGIYYTLFKALYEKFNKIRLRKKEFGMLPVPYAQVTALKKNPDGTYSECSYNEIGLIVANSATTMSGYKNNKEKTLEMIVRDDQGRDWISSNVYGYIDEVGGVHVKGRYGKHIKFDDNVEIPPFIIEDIVCKDTKNILSCSVTGYSEEDNNYPIVNIEIQPGKQVNMIKLINSIQSRCRKVLPSNIVDQLCFRFMNYEQSFPLSSSGKRSIPALEAMKLDNVIRYNGNDNVLEFVKDEKRVKAM